MKRPVVSTNRSAGVYQSPGVSAIQHQIKRPIRSSHRKGEPIHVSVSRERIHWLGSLITDCRELNFKLGLLTLLLTALSSGIFEN